jgi:hypothetical protein
MSRHDRRAKEKHLAGESGPASRRPRAKYGYADTPGWIMLVESGRGAIDEIGLLAALWIGIRSIGRWLGRLARR